jgi:hypothetical protein
MLKLKYKMSRILRSLAREGGAFNVNNKVLHFDLPAYDGQYRNLAKHHLVLQFDPKLNDDTPYNWGFGAINDSGKDDVVVSYTTTNLPQTVKLITKTDMEFYDNKAIFRNVYLESSKKGRLAYEQYVNILNANLNKYKYDTDDENWLSLWGNKKLGIDNFKRTDSASTSENPLYHVHSNNQFQSIFVDYENGTKNETGTNGVVLIIPLSDLMDIASCDAMSCDEFGDLTVGIELESIFPVISELYNPANLCFYDEVNPPDTANKLAVNLNNCFTYTEYYQTNTLIAANTLSQLNFFVEGGEYSTQLIDENGDPEDTTFVGNGLIADGDLNVYQAYEAQVKVVKAGVETNLSGLINCVGSYDDLTYRYTLAKWGIKNAATSSTTVPQILLMLSNMQVITLPADGADLGTSTVNAGWTISMKLKPLEKMYVQSLEDGVVSGYIVSNGSSNLYTNQTLLENTILDANNAGLINSSTLSACVVSNITYDNTNNKYLVEIAVQSAQPALSDPNAYNVVSIYFRPLLNASNLINEGVLGTITRPDSSKWSIEKAEMVEVITSMNESTRSMFEQNVGMCSRFYRSYKVEPFLMTDTYNFVRQFQIEPETVACMLLTPTGTGKNTCLISKQDGVVSYTVNLDGTQTTNRDITLLEGNGVATGAIHQDRLLKTMEEMGVEVKQIQELDQKQVVYPERIQLLEKFNPNGPIRTIQFNLNSDGTNILKGKMVYLFKSILKSL